MVGFLGDVGLSFAYPMRGQNRWPFLGGVIVLAALGAALSTPFNGLAGIALCGLVGYTAAYLADVVAASAEGRSDAPQWPDLAELAHTDRVLALLPYLLFVLLPLALPEFFARAPLVTVAAVVPLLAYLPMGLLAVALLRDVQGLHPLFVVRSIRRVGAPYAAVCAVLLVLIGLETLLLGAIARVSPALSRTVDGPLALFRSMVFARVLGLLYWHNKDNLDWLAV